LHADERGETAATFLARAVAFFAEHGIRTQRVLTDNGSPLLSQAWSAACADVHVRHRSRTRPYRPQTNSTVECFFRTTIDECQYVHSFDSDAHRAAALQTFVCYYNIERPHLGLRGLTPCQREPGLVTKCVKKHTLGAPLASLTEEDEMCSSNVGHATVFPTRCGPIKLAGLPVLVCILGNQFHLVIGPRDVLDCASVTSNRGVNGQFPILTSSVPLQYSRHIGL
jgi:hypothetical protein